MILYLLRHGKPVDPNRWSGGDRSRPLVKEGEDAVRELLKVLRHEKAINVDAVLTSPYLRAVQTAHIAAEVLETKVKAHESLGSGASPADLIATVAAELHAENLLLVGHSPDLNRLIAELSRDSVSLPPGAIAKLSGAVAAGGMRLEFVRIPERAPG